MAKVHEKLKNPKHVSVSMDSLLGLLSSVYGTEDLDIKTVFNKNTTNLGNLSVESFITTSNKVNLAGGDEKNLNRKESERINVATSTTSLKANRNSESKVDVTLMTIKSLENLKQDNNNTEHERSKDNSNTEHEKSAENVDEIDDKIMFDIKFTKKDQSEIIPTFDIDENEICINVTDISKRTKTTIEVPKRHLLSKIQYFYDIDKEFGLDNLNVLIVCNLSVFQWIVQWIKADIPLCKPNLNVSNLKNVLSVAYHLGIDELIKDCLDFFHKNFKDVLESDIDIENVFDDNLVFKLAQHFSNTEVNEISDDFESFKIKLFCSFIKLLVELCPCSRLGHYSTLATIFQCGLCEKFIGHNIAELVLCKSDCNQINFRGELVPFHKCSPSWNLSRYIELMYEELKSWKLVYWKLWGMCHFVNCEECDTLYPLSQSDWCSFHPMDIEYFSVNVNLSYPIGRYKCCGEKAFKFNVLKPYGGCHFKSHTPKLNSNEQVEMYKIYQTHKHYISCRPPEKPSEKKFVKLIRKSSEDELLQNESVSEKFWWQGICLAPKEKKDYSIIPLKMLDQLRNRPQKMECIQKVHPLNYKPQVHFGIMPQCTVSQETDSTNETFLVRNNKQKSKQTAVKKNSLALSYTKSKTKRKKSSSHFNQPTEFLWSNSDSIKNNQDNQRDFEEIAMRNLSNKLISGVTTVHPEPAAGTYIRLEADWWQEHVSDSARSSYTAKQSGTVVNRTFPLSWFRKATNLM